MGVIPLNVLLVLISPTVLIGVLGLTSSFLRILAFVTPWQDLTTSIRSSFSRGSSFSRSPFSRPGGLRIRGLHFLGSFRFRGLRFPRGLGFLGGLRFRGIFGLRSSAFVF